MKFEFVDYDFSGKKNLCPLLKGKINEDGNHPIVEINSLDELVELMNFYVSVEMFQNCGNIPQLIVNSTAQ